MKLVNELEGNGTVTAQSGEKWAVRYAVRYYQPDSTNVQLMRGSILPVVGVDQKDLVLEMEKGGTLKFYFTDAETGRIASVGLNES